MSMDESVEEDVAGTVGAGDSEREGAVATDDTCGLRMEGREAPQSSHVGIDGWLRNVQRGHSVYAAPGGLCPLGGSRGSGGRDKGDAERGALAGRFDIAAIVAFVSTTKGGLIPHA